MYDKPSIPKGTRDFSPEVLEKRNYIFDIIKTVYQKFGYKPIETPAMENLSTLMGKYGEEGDKLLFKILNSGNFLKNVSDNEINERDTSRLSSLVCEKGLRYDLTVPFARYVVQYQSDIVFPFKRYQIQPVWRADRPQKGRYREFYQCDADIVGSRSLINELEIVQMIDEVFTKLNLKVSIRINNRKILAGIAESIGYPDKMNEITSAIDKLDKIDYEEVLKEIIQSGIEEKAVKELDPILKASGAYETKISIIKKCISNSEIGQLGIEEIDEIFSYIKLFKFNNKVEFDITLARGLNYYTGAIFEVISEELSIGSICGGGRYDDLTGIFGLTGVSGVGISFGADRIYDVIENLKRFPENTSQHVRIMFTNTGKNSEVIYSLKLLEQMRAFGFKAEIYPDDSKLKKQFKYANDNKIPFVVIAGENEIELGKVTVKNMNTGIQQMINAEEIFKIIEK